VIYPLYDESDFDAGTYDGVPFLKLSTAQYRTAEAPDPRSTDDDDGHLEADAWWRTHSNL
jgi:hypothetical protein